MKKSTLLAFGVIALVILFAFLTSCSKRSEITFINNTNDTVIIRITGHNLGLGITPKCKQICIDREEYMNANFFAIKLTSDMMTDTIYNGIVQRTNIIQ